MEISAEAVGGGETPSSPSLCVAMPLYDGRLTSITFKSLLRLQHKCAAEQIRFEVINLDGVALLPLARNELVAKFMAGDFANMLFLDSDIGFDASDIINAYRSSYDVVCGIYRCRDDSMRFSYEPMRAASVEADGFIEIERGGTGCMLIRRHVLQKMMGLYPDTYRFYSTTRLHRLFDTEIDESGIMIGEDYAFCRRWRAIGGRIHADTKANMTHVGAKVFGAPWHA